MAFIKNFMVREENYILDWDTQQKKIEVYVKETHPRRKKEGKNIGNIKYDKFTTSKGLDYFLLE